MFQLLLSLLLLAAAAYLFKKPPALTHSTNEDGFFPPFASKALQKLPPTALSTVKTAQPSPGGLCLGTTKRLNDRSLIGAIKNDSGFGRASHISSITKFGDKVDICLIMK